MTGINLNRRLISLSVLTLTYDEDEGLQVAESPHTHSYKWIAYILPKLYRGIRSGKANHTNINSGLLGQLMKTESSRKWDIVGRENIIKRTLPLYKCIANREFNRLASTEGVINQSISATPFFGIGSSLPVDISRQGAVACGHILADPILTHVAIVGDLAEAQTVLGKGLERIRAVTIGYYGLQPANSISAEFPLPFIYSEWANTPTVTELVEYLSIEQAKTKKSYHLTGVATLASALYTLLEMDHGYLDIQPLSYSSNYPSEWRVSTGTSTTHIPFRWPLLVYLLGIAGYQKEIEVPKESLELRSMLDSWGRTSLLSTLSSVYGDDRAVPQIIYDLPSLVKSYFVALYRLSCKTIKLPSKSEFPRRSEASRMFVEVFSLYEKNKSIGAYLDLGEKMLECSFQQVEGISELSEILHMDAYTMMTTSVDQLPPLRAKLSDVRELDAELLSLDRHRQRLSYAKNVHIDCELGNIKLVTLFEDSINTLLASLEDVIQEDKYRLFDKGSLKRLISRNSVLCEGYITEESITLALDKLYLSLTPLHGTSLLRLIKWHKELPDNPNIIKVLEIVIEVLSVVFLDPTLNGVDYSDARNEKRDITVVGAIIERIEKELR